MKFPPSKYFSFECESVNVCVNSTIYLEVKRAKNSWDALVEEEQSRRTWSTGYENSICEHSLFQRLPQRKVFSLNGKLSIWGKNELDPLLTPYTKTNFWWILDVNIRNKTVKLLEDNGGEYLHGLGTRKDSQTGLSKH